jgi:serine/threonine-protein kinase
LTDVLSRLSAAFASHYAIERELGRGGMATVYLARDLKHHRRVALKVLRPELTIALGPDRFLREIEIAAQFAHPHIVPVFDSGEAEGFLYYVMPYVVGESLRSRLVREGQLPLEDAVEIACEVADALTYAHAHGIVHRDIKPENILLAEGHAVVADFGIARAISAASASYDDRMTGAGLAIGTPLYMSPEQGAGHRQLDGRADLYSLGCVLYEMLAGEPPFIGPTPQAVINQHAQNSPEPLSEKRPGVPPEVEQVVTRALHKLPADRFASAADFGAALRRVKASRPRQTRLRPRAIAAVILAGVAVAGIAMVWRAATNSPDHAVGIVVVPFEETGYKPANRPPPHLLLTEALGWLPSIRPIDGRRLLSAQQSWRETDLADLERRARGSGGKYLITGTIAREGGRSRLTIDLYATKEGARVAHEEESAPGDSLDSPIGRLAVQSILALAVRESVPLGAQRSLLTSTSSAEALGHLLKGQSDLWRDDFSTAAAEFGRAIQSDSTCGPAYYRLSVAQERQHEFPSALATVEAGLTRRPQLAPVWGQLLEAQRYFLLGAGDSAIADFQGVVLDDRDNIDGWLGLGESLFHLGGFFGYRPEDAASAFERLAILDSTSVPVFAQHLVDLAIFTGDEEKARRWLPALPQGRNRSSREAAVELRFGDPSKHARAFQQLRGADRQVLSELMAIWTRDLMNPAVAESLGVFLTGPGMTPDDRRRGADFRLVALASRGRWPEAVAAWRAAAGDGSIDTWVIQADLAGHPAHDIAEPMFAWARGLARSGRIPDFSLPLWDDLQQAFQALAQKAIVEGDSTEVLHLIAAIKEHLPAAAPTDPIPRSLEAALNARLALLGADTNRAITLLAQSVGRIAEPFTWFYPLTAMAQERLLLAELLIKSGSYQEGKRRLDSFSRTWAIGDALYLPRVRQIARQRPP